MAQEFVLWDESYKAAADLDTKRFFAVELTAENTVNVCNNAADVAIGILQNLPKSGESAQVRLLGLSKAVTDGSGAAIAVNDPLKTNASGKLVKAVTNNDWVIARAEQASTADGTIITVRMTGGFHLGV